MVSDMLPASIADDPRQRHDFLREHLRGCDTDPFALEIARLSLTLADIPNENGWVLEQANMFASGYWFQNRDKLGLLRHWPHQGIYQQFSNLDLLPSVSSVLKKYERWAI